MNDKQRPIDKARKLLGFIRDTSITDEERDTAQRRLDALMTRYNILLPELEEDEPDWKEFKFRTAFEKQLLFQINYAVTGVKSATYLDDRRTIWLKLTHVQAITCARMYAAYRTALKQHFDDSFHGFIQANNIFPQNSGGSGRLSEEELEKLLRYTSAVTPTVVNPELKG